ncbi:MAG: PA14 domain-containing protein [Planctomycetota bacterium]|nr:PA14 domain-containing protein [Planctomycetota bacterium]MDA1213773.1 PA14 domain-containing protein [Planctomycetota bacterium]
MIEYFEKVRGARLTFFWQPLGFPHPSIVPSAVLFPTEKHAAAKGKRKPLPDHGLVADYFDVDFKKPIGRSFIHRTETLWGEWAAESFAPIDAGVRYSGYLVAPTTGRYKFEAFADDEMRVWINENPVLFATLATNKGFASAYVELEGKTAHSLRMEYLDATANGQFLLHWIPPGFTDAMSIPCKALYPIKKAVPKEINFAGK